MKARGSNSQCVGVMTPVALSSQGKHSIAQASSCLIHFGQEVMVTREERKRAAAHEAGTDMNLGPPYLCS